MTVSRCILLKKACALHVTLVKAAIYVKEETVAAQDQTLATVATAHVRDAIAAKVVIHVRDVIAAKEETVAAQDQTLATVVTAAKVVLQVRVVVLVGALTVLVNRAMATIVPLLVLVLVVTFVVHLLVIVTKTSKETK